MRYRFIMLLACSLIYGQEYTFEPVIDLAASSVISQGRTGTCWSFSSTSFLESEIIRLTGKRIDLSELYPVRKTFPAKMENYIMRQGKAQLSQGGLSHDVFNTIKAYGLVPASAYTGLVNGNTDHDHGELMKRLKAIGERYVNSESYRIKDTWRQETEALLDASLGKEVMEFSYGNETYTPKSFLKMTGINPDSYISLTSFMHAPFYSDFILNIPDNWSNGSFYNVPLDELVETINSALTAGFTVELDCDVSEATFSSRHGVAVVPNDAKNNKRALQQPVEEKEISQKYRQGEFESYATTDDHLMHITGTAKDQNGKLYYKVKNSWGTNPARNAYDGHVYFSESYLRLKTISITLHKDALPNALKRKMVP